MILTVIMAVMLVPTHAFAADDETAADISPRSAYTLYNYISLNNGSNYVALHCSTKRRIRNTPFRGKAAKQRFHLHQP